MSTSKIDSHQPKNTLRVLLVEDTKDRQHILTSLYKKHAWILVNTGERAITLLNAYDFDIVSLDYNLGGQLNGADVAKVLKYSRHKNVRVIVHSLNPRGAKVIASILPDAIIYPVAKMVRSNKLFKYLRNRIDELGQDYDWS